MAQQVYGASTKQYVHSMEVLRCKGPSLYTGRVCITQDIWYRYGQHSIRWHSRGAQSVSGITCSMYHTVDAQRYSQHVQYLVSRGAQHVLPPRPILLRSIHHGICTTREYVDVRSITHHNSTTACNGIACTVSRHVLEEVLALLPLRHYQYYRSIQHQGVYSIREYIALGSIQHQGVYSIREY